MKEIKQMLKDRIKVVEREIKNEKSHSKKARLNKYKQKLEIQLREHTRKLNIGGNL